MPHSLAVFLSQDVSQTHSLAVLLCFTCKMTLLLLL